MCGSDIIRKRNNKPHYLLPKRSPKTLITDKIGYIKHSGFTAVTQLNSRFAPARRHRSEAGR